MSPSGWAAKRATRSRIQHNDILFSTASIWEVAIKTRLGRPDFAVRAEDDRGGTGRGFAELLIRWQSASVVADLPMHHRDPFDRILLAQAITEPIHLYTVDRKLAPYSSLWCWPYKHGSQRIGSRSHGPNPLTSSPT